MKGKLNVSDVMVLLDTGCSKSMIGCELVHANDVVDSCMQVMTASGDVISVVGEADVCLCVDGREFVLNVLVMKRLPDSVDVIAGMDLIKKAGGLCLYQDGYVRLGDPDSISYVCGDDAKFDINKAVECYSACFTDVSHRT